LKFYAISGLGADHRVFEKLDLDFPLEVIRWKPGFKNKTLQQYAEILSSDFSRTEKIGLIGVSFGGVMALEISKILPIEKIILISSFTTYRELPRLGRALNKTGLLKIIPSLVYIPPALLATYLFGAKDKILLKSILKDTDPAFAKWATINLLKWQGIFDSKKLIRIHGDSDRMIGCPSSENTNVISDGGHFMIVDRAIEITGIINREMKK